MPPPSLETYGKILVLGTPPGLRASLEPQYGSKGALFRPAGQIVQDNRLPESEINAIIHFGNLTDTEHRTVSRLANGRPICPIQTPQQLNEFLRMRLKDVVTMASTDKISPGLREIIDSHIPKKDTSFNVKMVVKRSMATAAANRMRVSKEEVLAYALEVRKNRQAAALQQTTAENGTHNGDQSSSAQDASGAAPAADDVPIPEQAAATGATGTGERAPVTVPEQIVVTGASPQPGADDWKKHLKWARQGSLTRFVQDRFDAKACMAGPSMRVYDESLLKLAKANGFPSTTLASVSFCAAECRKSHALYIESLSANGGKPPSGTADVTVRKPQVEARAADGDESPESHTAIAQQLPTELAAPTPDLATAVQGLCYSALTPADKWNALVGLLGEFRHILFPPSANENPR